MKKFKLQIDKKLCIGCGCCSEIEPTVFTLDKQGKSTIKIEPKKEQIFDNTSGKYKNVEDAAKSCPVAAIIIAEVKS